MASLKRRNVERGWSEVGGVGLLGGGGVGCDEPWSGSGYEASCRASRSEKVLDK